MYHRLTCAMKEIPWLVLEALLIEPVVNLQSSLLGVIYLHFNILFENFVAEVQGEVIFAN